MYLLTMRSPDRLGRITADRQASNLQRIAHDVSQALLAELSKARSPRLKLDICNALARQADSWHTITDGRAQSRAKPRAQRSVSPLDVKPED